jgi:hypothetical protein
MRALHLVNEIVGVLKWFVAVTSVYYDILQQKE